jgi:hypothetical protein
LLELTEDEAGGAAVLGAVEVVVLCELICPVIWVVNCEKPTAGNVASSTLMSCSQRLKEYRRNCAQTAQELQVN